MDTTPYGKRAWAYVKALLEVVGKEHLRLISAGPLDLWPYDDTANPWSTYQDLLITPLAEPFINVVCCDPAKVDPRRYYVTTTLKLDGTSSPCRGNFVVLTLDDARLHHEKITGFKLLPMRPDPALPSLLPSA